MGPSPATSVIDSDGTVQYEQVADRPGDRTNGNFVRDFIRGGVRDPFTVQDDRPPVRFSD